MCQTIPFLKSNLQSFSIVRNKMYNDGKEGWGGGIHSVMWREENMKNS